MVTHANPRAHDEVPTRPRTVGGLEAAVRGDATIDDLVMVIAGWPEPLMTDPPVFSCVECKRKAATAIDDARWRCGACRHTGTIFALRRVVLEDAHLSDRLLDLLTLPRVDVPAEPIFPDVWRTA